MEKLDLTCIGCPLGCLLSVEKDEDNIKVMGNTCPNGEKYAKEEVTNPKRILTSSVRVRGGEDKLCSVKTSSPIPKDIVLTSSKEIRKIIIDAPVEMGAIIIHDLLNTGVDLVATREVKAKK